MDREMYADSYGYDNPAVPMSADRPVMDVNLFR